MKIKYFKLDGTEEIVEVPEEQPTPPVVEDVTPEVDAELLKRALLTLCALLVVVLGVVAVALMIWQAARGC